MSQYGLKFIKNSKEYLGKHYPRESNPGSSSTTRSHDTPDSITGNRGRDKEEDDDDDVNVDFVEAGYLFLYPDSAKTTTSQHVAIQVSCIYYCDWIYIIYNIYIIIFYCYLFIIILYYLCIVI